MEKEIKLKKKKNRAGFKDTLYLKSSLLGIWILKNIKVLIVIALLAYLVLILTGNATGGIIFGPVSQIIKDVTSSTTAGDWIMNILALLVTVSSCAGIFLKKTRHIALKDIKSKKLKLAILAGGFYFNTEGKLTKRVENSLRFDVNEDGKINSCEEEKKEPENIVDQTVSAVTELFDIVTTKVESQETVPEIKETEIKEDLEETSNENLDETIESVVSETLENRLPKLPKETIRFTSKFLIGIKNMLRKIFKRKKKEIIAAEDPNKELLPEHDEPLFEKTEIEDTIPEIIIKEISEPIPEEKQIVSVENDIPAENTETKNKIETAQAKQKRMIDEIRSKYSLD